MLSYMGHVGLKTRLLDQIIEKKLVYTIGASFFKNFHKSLSECLFCQCLGQVRIWATSGKKLGQ